MSLNPRLISRSNLEGIRTRSRSLNLQGNEKLEVENRFKDFIRAESKKMTRHWNNTAEQQSKQRQDEQVQLKEKHSANQQRSYEELRENQKRAQRERIEKIESSVRRSQPGPRLLDSAALLSECVHVQRQQRREMALRTVTNRQNALNEGKILALQNQQWQREHQRRRQEELLRAERYHFELRGMIAEKRYKQRDEFLVQRQMEDAARFRAMERERREMERRRALLRHTATEAMRMAEQRRLRDRQEERVQEVVCEEQLRGQERQREVIEERRNALSEAQRLRQERAKEQVGEILRRAGEAQEENEALVERNAAEELRRQLEAKERAEVERKKRLKAQRIQIHIEEMQAEKQRKEEREKERKEEVKERLENDQVTREFAREQKLKRTQQAAELRSKLAAQWEEKCQTEREIKAGVQLFSNRQCDFSRDHRDFVRFAGDALQVARQRELPVQPFVKAIESYSRENFVEEKPLLPHLRVCQPPVYYDRPELPAINDKETIRYNIEQLKSLNPEARTMVQ